MAVLNRGVQKIWDNQSTGVDGASEYAVVGAQTNVAVHVEVDGATVITFESAYSANRSAGRNYLPGDEDAHTYYSIYSNDSIIGSSPAPSSAGAVMVRRPLEVYLEGAGKFTIEISPYTPNFLRLKSSADVTATAVVEVVG